MDKGPMISVFVSYAHADAQLKDRFLVHLTSLQREGLIDVWHDRMLKPGEHLDSEIEKELEAANVVILLISPDFIHSNYCTEKEMQRAFARAKSGLCKVVAVILKPCRWSHVPIEEGGRLGDFLATPPDGKPVTQWKNRDEAWKNVIADIQRLIIDETRGRPVGRPSISDGTSSPMEAFVALRPKPELSDVEPARLKEPIQWYFKDNNLIFGWNEARDGTFLVGTFNFRGKNVSGEPIAKIESYVMPQISAIPLHLKFYNPRETDLLDTKGRFIQPNAEFQLSYKIPSYDKENSLQGVPVDLFLSEYGGIKFIFNHDGKAITHDFSYSDVKAVLLRHQEQHEEKRKPIPGVKKIQN